MGKDSPSDELAGQTQRASAGQGLQGGEALVGDDLVVSAQGQLDGVQAERRGAANRAVLVVHVGLQNALGGGQHRRQDDRLAIVVTVSTDTQVQLLRALVGVERLRDTQN